MTDTFFLQLAVRQDYLPQQQGGSKPEGAEFPQSGVSGGKNSETGKRIFLKESQGSSVSQEHSFVGIQKS